MVAELMATELNGDIQLSQPTLFGNAGGTNEKLASVRRRCNMRANASLQSRPSNCRPRGRGATGTTEGGRAGSAIHRRRGGRTALLKLVIIVSVFKIIANRRGCVRLTIHRMTRMGHLQEGSIAKP